MVPDLEPGAYLHYHIIVQIETIVRYDSFGKSISTYNFSLDEIVHYYLRHIGIRRCLYPFGKVVDDYKDEMMVI